MMATWFQALPRHPRDPGGLGQGREHPALPGGSAIELAGDRAIANQDDHLPARQARGTPGARGLTGRFHDFVTRHRGMKLLHRQPIYEKDRILRWIPRRS
jgi:hypothetical protein